MENLLDIYKRAYRDALDLPSDYELMISEKIINDDRYVIVEGKVIVEIEELNNLLGQSRSEDEIDLILDGNVIGELNIINKNKLLSATSELNASKICYCIAKAYLDDVNLSYQFEKHFLLINEDFIEEYINEYSEISIFWGGFSHTPKNFEFTPEIDSIELPKKFTFPTTHNKDIAFSSLFCTSPLEKYLRDYHQLELLFNLVLIKKLQSITIADMSGVNSIYKELRKSEMESILYIIENFIDNDEMYLKIIVDTFVNNEDLCEEIFQKYTKDSNPVNDQKWEKFKLFIHKSYQDSCSSMDDFFNVAIHKEVAFAQSGKMDDFIKMIKKINAYWIYRIRCSIAHTKLGEFIFEYNHDSYEFIHKYAIPLIKTTILNVFSNNNFKTLF
ncbi:hypothetical protein [Acinetobacter sp. UBA3106]|uniref:hypothetical protein n=1 Tax=Acinetobacter sp. UBA3106 TaxID=1945936 RepID=UPI0025BB99DD|nr:hypothetical protein [Acinetobacter sp. UBA3106]